MVCRITCKCFLLAAVCTVQCVSNVALYQNYPLLFIVIVNHITVVIRGVIIDLFFCDKWINLGGSSCDNKHFSLASHDACCVLYALIGGNTERPVCTGPIQTTSTARAEACSAKPGTTNT